MAPEDREQRRRERRHRDRGGEGRTHKKRRHKDKDRNHRDRDRDREVNNNDGDVPDENNIVEDDDEDEEEELVNDNNNKSSSNNANNGGVARHEESFITNDYTEATDGDVSTLHDRELAELQLLCDAATSDDMSSWEKIRRWLRNHSADDARAAAERRGDYETTPLHLACRNCPPLDIVNMLLTASPKTVELADSFGWLPLHYGKLCLLLLLNCKMFGGRKIHII